MLTQRRVRRHQTYRFAVDIDLGASAKPGDERMERASLRFKDDKAAIFHGIGLLLRVEITPKFVECRPKIVYPSGLAGGEVGGFNRKSIMPVFGTGFFVGGGLVRGFRALNERGEFLLEVLDEPQKYFLFEFAHSQNSLC